MNKIAHHIAETATYVAKTETNRNIAQQIAYLWLLKYLKSFIVVKYVK